MVTPLKNRIDDQDLVAFFHARDRRRSLAGVPDLFRTHHFLNESRTLTVSDATNATPIVITTTVDHGLVTGMAVVVRDVTGNTAANASTTVTVLTTTTFELDATVGNGVYISGGTVSVFSDIPVPLIETNVVFPDRSRVVTLKTAIRILPGTGAGLDEHRGLVFEFGGASAGAALWIGDQTIGLHAGSAGTDDGATALFDNGAELPDTLELDLVAAFRPGDGRIRLWANGREITRATAGNATFPTGWTGTNTGSFATGYSSAIVPDVPVASQGAPSGFEVIEPLSVYMGQMPRHFV